MVFKTLATTALLLGIVASNDIEAQEQASVTTSAKEQAEQRARAKLAEHLKIAPNEITVTRSEPQTWSDSSMGCGKRGVSRTHGHHGGVCRRAVGAGP